MVYYMPMSELKVGPSKSDLLYFFDKSYIKKKIEELYLSDKTGCLLTNECGDFND